MRRLWVLVGIVALVAGSLWFLGGRKDGSTSPDRSEDRGPVASVTAPTAPASRATSSGQKGEKPLPAGVTPEDVNRLRTLNSILEARNDNDPRMDTELKNLTPGTKTLLRGRYDELEPEKRNERGTIVFLVGRNLASAEDFRFLEDVLKEPACQSLADCAKASPASAREAMHDEMGDEVTLAYPQVMALKMTETYLSRRDTTPALRALAIRNLELARTSPVPVVSQMAGEMLSRLSRS